MGNINKILTFGVFLALLNFGFIYFVLPVISFSFYGIYFVLAINGLLLIPFGLLFKENSSLQISISGGGFVLFLLYFIIIIGGGIYSSWMFNSTRYENQIGQVSENVFETDVATVSPEQIRVVDQSLAKRRAEELLGQDPGLGSKVRVGDMSIQSVRGKLVWVAALEPTGLWKWKDMDGTPGYAEVSATNYRDAKLVLNKHMRYTEDSYYGYNIYRHIWMNGYSNIGITDFTLELDDDNNPWWVVTIYEHSIGFSGDEATGVLVVDPQTGDIKKYNIADAPSWIDRIQPEDFVINQLDAWGMLKKGWFNQTLFGAMDGVTKSANTASLVYTEDGHPSWYIGMKSAGNDEGTVGFVLVDSRNKQAKIYRIAGPTEDAAKHVLEGAVSNFNGYHASEPLMYNINGLPTYAATIKDGAGNIKKFGFVSASNRSVFGVGDNIQQALVAYQASISSNGMVSSVNSVVELGNIVGIVTRFSTVTSGGNQTSYVMIDKNPNKVFRISLENNPIISLTHVGDKISMKFADGNSSIIDVIEFSNESILLKKSESETKIDDEKKQTINKERSTLIDHEADDKFNKLSSEDKKKILDAIKNK